jgi:hypothetical protein
MTRLTLHMAAVALLAGTAAVAAAAVPPNIVNGPTASTAGNRELTDRALLALA